MKKTILLHILSTFLTIAEFALLFFVSSKSGIIAISLLLFYSLLLYSSSLTSLIVKIKKLEEQIQNKEKEEEQHEKIETKNP